MSPFFPIADFLAVPNGFSVAGTSDAQMHQQCQQSESAKHSLALLPVIRETPTEDELGDLGHLRKAGPLGS